MCFLKSVLSQTITLLLTRAMSELKKAVCAYSGCFTINFPDALALLFSLEISVYPVQNMTDCRNKEKSAEKEVGFGNVNEAIEFRCS